MRHSAKMFGGVLLILIGASLLLSMIGIHLGGLIGLAIGAWLLYWGYSKWQQKGGWSFLNIFLLTIGSLFMIGSLGGVISLLIGIALMYGGYKLLKSKQVFKDDEIVVERRSTKSTYDTIDEEFVKLMKEKQTNY